jgi:HSP20 family molecular chaperone IbpA
MAKKKEKALVIPTVCPYHDEKDENLIIEVELPGVKKKDVELSMTDESFCATGERADSIYHVCYRFLHEITLDEAKAKFDSGLLTITVPFQKPAKPREITIE